jgi:threonine dehydratase
MTLFSMKELDEARSIVGMHVAPTPTHAYPLLNEAIGTTVFVKHENATPTGAFKVRGGILFMHRLKQDLPHVTGVVSATRGNHGISLAFAGRAFDVPVVICVPEGNGQEKNSAMRALGAEVIVHGQDFQSALQHSMVVAADRGLEPVPPFHRDLVNGVATYAYELLTGTPDLDAIFVPVGMGSGICGLITTRDLLGLSTKIIGVGAAEAPAQRLSFLAKEVVSTTSAHTFIDGVATRQPDPTASAIIGKGAADIILVSEDEAAEAIRLLWRSSHHLAEPAGAVALAGLVNHRVGLAGKRVAFILCGANMDTDMAAMVLAGRTPPP